MIKREHMLLFKEVERLLQVNWHDVGMHAAFQYTDMEDLVSRRSPARQFGNILGIKQEKKASLRHQ